MLIYKECTIVDPATGDTIATTDVATIDGFSRYLIGADGVVYAIAKHRRGRYALDVARKKLEGLTDGATVEADAMVSYVVGGGYIQTTLIDDAGAAHQVHTHRIVATAFIGEISDGMVVDHIDFDRRNASASNLQIISQRENVRRSIAAGRCPQLTAGVLKKRRDAVAAE